jgi:hypothetical protein
MTSYNRIRSHERQRKDRQIEETVHDPYRERYKPEGPAFCPQCSAVFHDGRWQWGEKHNDAIAHLCPACRRINDAYPAGYVTLSGAFAAEHAKEILGLVTNEEARAKAEHPLERIMETRAEDAKTVITTTGTHLARRIGEALQHAWKGDLEIKHSQDEHLVRVWWER